MVNDRFQGTGTALVTPFTSEGELDEAAVSRLVDFQLAAGVEMILPCGTTGEGINLTIEEYEQIVTSIVERVAGRAVVIAGAGSNSTKQAINLAKLAKACGADGILSVGPYYNKPTQAGFVEHFRAIAEVDDLPVVIYNVPSRTGSNILPETVLSIAQIPGVVAVKESSGSLVQAMEIIKNKPEGFRVLSGDDWAALPILAMGGDGVVSVAANEVPERIHEMVEAALAGEIAQARAFHYSLLPLMQANFIETNPIPVKAMLSMMGLITESYRLPLVPISPENRMRLRQVAQDAGLVLKAEV